MAVLEVRGLTVAYGDHLALNEVSLSVEAGQVLGLLGPNGAGKSTLMGSVVGAVRPRSGTVRVCGVDVASRPRRARAHVGYAEQDIAVFPTLTVRENVADWAALSGLRSRELAGAVARTLSALLLDDIADRQVRTLSGGQRRRVHCAMATVSRPPLLLLDEPTVGVDPATRRAVLDHVLTLAAEGAAICYSTHYLPEIESLDAEVVLLNKGVVAARGAVATLLRRYGRTVVDLRLGGDSGEVRTVSSAVEGPDDLPAILQGLGPDLARLSGLEIRRSSLDEVFERVVEDEEGALDAS
ncbi:ABC-2 type transport system ATP-binding protein [Thermocatellispora tengchongensis]|uniref:ABC-2 type transport system ATP-binding protein n=1 Tax=Thermocatellispora tengchongensis TaxID=1073253 RepID=A0A840NXP3_9ACTN|nr:ABC transporter ATP-binding protein [Thermocatellispora tengchongensis]MBB5132278.1 ABC-2 type transport system ATP-binding protein [Thermocatellispora tengchongensis]